MQSVQASDTQLSNSQGAVLTASDLVARFGSIALSRIRLGPPPRPARERDVIEIHAREDRLFELIDGILVEKVVGTYESYLATLLAEMLSRFVRENRLGIVLGPDGMMHLAPGLVRIPDVSFVGWRRFPDGRLPRGAFIEHGPDLAVEIISKGNTPREMDAKLQDYFAAATALVWYVYPDDREIHVFTSPAVAGVFREGDILEGGNVLPGFRLDLAQYFAEPAP